jgi:predicted nucleic acid-binding protein
VIVPEPVLSELGSLNPADPAAIAVRSEGWIQVVASPPIPDALKPFRLDRGEASVLAVALTPFAGETQVVLDDLAARRCAATLGLEFRGTLTFLLVAKAEGRIPAVRPLLETLHQSGMRLSATLCRHVLELAEEWGIRWPQTLTGRKYGPTPIDELIRERPRVTGSEDTSFHAEPRPRESSHPELR